MLGYEVNCADNDKILRWHMFVTIINTHPHTGKENNVLEFLQVMSLVQSLWYTVVTLYPENNHTNSKAFNINLITRENFE